MKARSCVGARNDGLPTGPLGPPDETGRPLFVYGMLKPDEVAWPQISHLEPGVEEAVIRGYLWIRDGLPLLQLSDDGHEIHGWILEFNDSTAITAYQIVGDFEPAAHYEWARVELGAGHRNLVNVVVCRGDITAGAVELDGHTWSSALDPTFTYGLNVVREACKSLATEPFKSAPSEQFDWPRLFRLQNGIPAPVVSHRKVLHTRVWSMGYPDQEDKSSQDR